MRLFLVCILTLTAGYASSENVTWVIRHGLDNLPVNDIMSTGTSDVETLKQLCLANLYCKGFSSHFGTLKFSLDNLGNQSNTDLYVRVSAPPPIPPPPTLHVWPNPSSMMNGASTVTLNNNTFHFSIVGATNAILERAITRHRRSICPRAEFFSQSRKEKLYQLKTTESGSLQDSEIVAASAEVSGCDISIQQSEEVLAVRNDESYSLIVPADGGRIKLNAQTVWGALHGLETLEQLVQYDWTGHCSIEHAPINITDRPRFPYRGLMIDTARHYLPVQVILQHLEAMSSSKMNVLHWHVSDSGAFPLELSSLPRLAQYGSYDPVRAVYTHEDVREIVETARERGIRVLPEFDTPCHAESWMKGYPELQGHSACACMDPSSEQVWSFFDIFIRELSTLFTDPVIHVGVDEVNYDCWSKSPEIVAWMSQQHLLTFGDVEGYWISRLSKIAAKYDRKVQVWHDPFANGAVLPAGTAVEVWGGGLSMVSAVTKSNYDAIYAAPWYLDNIARQWNDLYAQPISDGTMTPAQERNFLGGEAPMWGEWVDQANAVSRVWPRAAALAEILWSSNSFPKIGSIQATRLHSWRCRILQRGVRAEPVGPFSNTPMHCGPL